MHSESRNLLDNSAEVISEINIKPRSNSRPYLNERTTTTHKIITMIRKFRKELIFTTIIIAILFLVSSNKQLNQPSNHKFSYHKPFSNKEIANNPITPKPLIIYNRVGKCGSRSLLITVSEAVRLKYNDMVYISSPYNTQTYIKDYRQRLELIELLLLSTPEKPTFYSRHLNFLNFTNQPQDPSQTSIFDEQLWNRPVIHINMIRNPVDRFVSHFYFREYGDEGGGVGSKYHYENPMTIDECFEEEGKFCPDNMDFRGYFYIIPFFCGHDRFCIGKSQIDRRLALTQAKKNLEKYKVVGLLEEFDLTLEILKIELPEYFEHAIQIWEADKAKAHSKLANSKTKNKVPPSDTTKGMISQYMPEELEFYKVVRKRFEEKVIKYGLEHKLKYPIGYLDGLYKEYREFFEKAVDINEKTTIEGDTVKVDENNFFDLEKGHK